MQLLHASDCMRLLALCARTMTALVTTPPRRNTSPFGISHSQVCSSQPTHFFFFSLFPRYRFPVIVTGSKRPMAVRWRTLSGPVRHMASRIFSVTEEKRRGGVRWSGLNDAPGVTLPLEEK